ncbi:hypothetical protein BJ138DRAFT_1155143 [Hygrophoropsis aurantiaca]|uniref:Uncharacterized protein n=1 Tax=Hygrophoropsis aurantiaca TaxID=72124 RepID=A0ACB8A9T9_9AGAM|nr:hypothetical protein BJ138DRAFT_1155143 [Hygrophoropsis aurantiaca]
MLQQVPRVCIISIFWNISALWAAKRFEPMVSAYSLLSNVPYVLRLVCSWQPTEPDSSRKIPQAVHLPARYRIQRHPSVMPKRELFSAQPSEQFSPG